MARRESSGEGEKFRTAEQMCTFAEDEGMISYSMKHGACQLTFIPGEALAAYSCFSIVLSATPGRRRQLVRAQIGPALHDWATLGG